MRLSPIETNKDRLLPKIVIKSLITKLATSAYERTADLKDDVGVAYVHVVELIVDHLQLINEPSRTCMAG